MIALLSAACGAFHEQSENNAEKTPIHKPEISISDSVFSPEALWAMGRIGSVVPNEELSLVAYTVSYYSVAENRSTTWVRVCEYSPSNTGKPRLVGVFALSSKVANWRIGINVVIVVVAYLTTAVIIFSKHRSIRAMAALLLVLVQFTDLGLNDVFIYRAESVKELTAYEHNESNQNNSEAVDKVKALDSGFYRMETWSPSSENDSLAYAYNGVTSRDTASLKYSRSFLQRLGYNDDGSYVEYGHDNTVTADSILGIKYLLTHESHAPRLHKEIGRAHV